MLEDPTWTIAPDTDPTAKWRMNDGATIRIDPNDALTNLTGAVQMGSLGTLAFNGNYSIPADLIVTQGTVLSVADLTIQGNLQMIGGMLEEFGTSSILLTLGDLISTGGTIKIASGSVAYFGGAP